MKPLPHDNELEEIVLGAILFEQSAIYEVGDLLTDETFYAPKNKIIWHAVMAINSRNEAIDTMSLMAELKKIKKIHSIGGPVAITKLTDNVYGSANIMAHVIFLKQLEIKRKAILIATELAQKAYDSGQDSLELIELATDYAYKLSRLAEINPPRGPADFVNEVMAKSAKAMKHGGITGVQTGMKELDAVFGGFQDSDLIIVAGRPSMGKTGFVLCAARNACYQYGKKGLLFSLEMSGRQLTVRNLAIESGVFTEKIIKGNMSDYDAAKLTQAASRLSDNENLLIDDTGGLTITELSTKAKKARIDGKIDFIVIDYIQLLHDPTVKGNREQEISSISRKLKALAKTLNIPVIALSQLSRGPESRGGDKRPMLSDLRESGSIEQDADVVILLYRPEYYGIKEDESGNSTAGIAQVIIAKNRQGGVGEVPLSFNKQLVEFCDLKEQPRPMTDHADQDAWITPGNDFDFENN